MALGDGGAGKPPVPIVVMAVGAAEIELPLPMHEQLASFRDEALKPGIGNFSDGGAARVLSYESRQRKQLAAFVGQRRRLLVPGAAQVDALLQVDRTAENLVEGGIAGRDAFHAGARVVVAIGAGLVRAAGP